MNQSVQDFVAQVTEIARRAALETLGAAFSGRPATSGSVATASASGAAVARPAAARSIGRPAGGRGVKRAPEDIEAMGQKFVSFVKANPGLRIEQINKELGTTTKDLALPIRKLEADGVITTKGQRRATQYFPGKKAK
jgi:hypothetical protein